MTAGFVKFFAYMRHRPIVTTCFALVLLLGAANYFLWQQRARIALRDDEARRNGEFMLTALKNRAKIDTDLATLREAMAQIEGNLIDEQGMELNFGYFYRFEKMTRVRLTRLNQLAAPASVAGTRFKSVPFSLQVSGSYRSNMAFLRALESGPRIVRVRSCNFERPSETSTDLVMEITIDVLARS
jgi:Tfp pilus assembly protein PilO